MELYIGDSCHPIYTFKFDGSYYGIGQSYTGISVEVTFWWKRDSQYADPGGTGGFHYRLRNALVPFMRDKWNRRLGEFYLSEQKLPTPDINAWFQQHCQNIGNALISLEDSNRQEEINNYKSALLDLDDFVCKLKTYTHNSIDFIGDLITSEQIAQEIKLHVTNLDQHNLTPNVTLQLLNYNANKNNKIDYLWKHKQHHANANLLAEEESVTNVAGCSLRNTLI